MIENRLSRHSSSKDEFDKIKQDYNEALRKNGYSANLEYQPPNDKKKRTSKRKCIWFNPPFCKTVATKIGSTYLDLVKRHFNKDNPLSKIINKNNMKISYSCMNNVKAKIDVHNAKILNKNNGTIENQTDESKVCNCRNKNECPIKDNTQYTCREKT